VVLWSVVLWLVNALSFYIAFAAFGIQVSFVGACWSRPGLVRRLGSLYAGLRRTVRGGHRSRARTLRHRRERAFSYAIAYHATTFVPITLLGLWSVASTPIRLGDLRRRPTPIEPNQPP